MNINITGGQVNIVGGNSRISVNGEVIGSRASKTYTAHKEGKNYIVSGTVEKNIYIGGNLIVCGNRHMIISGRPLPNRKDLIVEGDFIVNGNSHDISNIVELHGNIIDSSNRSIIR